MKKQATTKPVTVRFSLGEYQKLLEEAEQQGGNIADILRASWSSYQNSQQHEDLLLRLEQRLKHCVFEILITMTKADENKRNLIIESLREKGIQW